MAGRALPTSVRLLRRRYRMTGRRHPAALMRQSKFRVRSDGSIELVVEAAIAGLFNDCDVQRANEAAALLCPMNAAVNQQPVTAAPWRDVSTTYVRCTDDQVPELLSAQFLDYVDDVVELPTGHCPQWSRPDLVAGLLLDRVPEQR